MKKRGALLLATFLAALVAGCGGGGGSTPSSPGAAATAAAGPFVPMTFTIAVSRDPQSARRSQYVSPSTQSIGGSVVPVAGGTAITAVGNCAPPATTCQLQLLAPVGLDVFTLSLYDQPSGAGNRLSTGTTTLQVVAGDTHDVLVTFNGLPATLQLLVTPDTAVFGTPSTGELEVIARDAGGNIILGPGTFNPPIVLSVSANFVTLGANQITDPSGPVTGYQYNGAIPISNRVTFTASMTGVASATATLTLVAGPPTPSPAPTATPAPTPTPTPLPTGVPTPVPTPTAPPGYVLLCSYTLSQGNGTVVTNPCNTAVVRFSSGLPTTIDFNFTNGRQGALLGRLSQQVGGATGWTAFTNGFNPVRITIGAQFPPGQATFVVTDGFGGYYQVGVVGN